MLELGLGRVIIQFASHEWSQLNLDESGEIIGESDSLSRLVSIGNIAFKWYLALGGITAFGLGIAGYVFFSTSASSNVSWVAPWFFLCFVTGLTITLVPIWSLLEGCNQVAQLYTFRFVQGLLSSLSVWVAMLSGAELWTASISGIVTLIASMFFLRRRYWVFVITLLKSKPRGPRIQWRIHMLPMQWRIAISWVSGYFVFFLFVPVLFKYHGPIIAGQMGLTWNLTYIVPMVASAWISPRAPQFGILIAQRRYDELDRQFWKITRVVTSIAILLATVIWIFVLALNASNYPIAIKLASRLLPPVPTGLFLLAQVIYASVGVTSVYLRAHKKEPLMMFSVIYAALVGSSTFFLGKHYSATGMAWGYLALNIICMPIAVFIWNQCRKAWHQP
jgi:hypothetical protein